jgi:hypothetical protein
MLAALSARFPRAMVAFAPTEAAGNRIYRRARQKAAGHATTHQHSRSVHVVRFLRRSRA